MPAPMFAPSVVMSPMSFSLRIQRGFATGYSADDLLDHLEQLGRVEWLHEPSRRSGATAGLLHLIARFGRQDEDRRGLELRVVAKLLRQADAVHARHVLVG